MHSGPDSEYGEEPAPSGVSNQVQGTIPMAVLKSDAKPSLYATSAPIPIPTTASIPAEVEQAPELDESFFVGSLRGYELHKARKSSLNLLKRQDTPVTQGFSPAVSEPATTPAEETQKEGQSREKVHQPFHS